jgi:hypothetical protein
MVLLDDYATEFGHQNGENAQAAARKTVER